MLKKLQKQIDLKNKKIVAFVVDFVTTKSFKNQFFAVIVSRKTIAALFKQLFIVVQTRSRKLRRSFKLIITSLKTKFVVADKTAVEIVKSQTRKLIMPPSKTKFITADKTANKIIKSRKLIMTLSKKQTAAAKHSKMLKRSDVVAKSKVLKQSSVAETKKSKKNSSKKKTFELKLNSTYIVLNIDF